MESGLQAAQREMDERANQLHGQVGDFTARALAQVTDSQLQLVTQLQHMREQLAALQAHAAALEPALRREVAAEYEGKTHRLQLQLLHLRSKLDISSLSIRARILAHYYGLKRSALEEMITTGSAPYPIKKRALGLLNSEAAFQATKEELYALQATKRKLDALASMRESTQARLFAAEQDHVAALVAEHEQLARRIQQCEARNASFEHELSETKNTLLSCRKYEQEMLRLFLVHRRDNAKLNQWKRSQLARLARLEAVSRAFDDVSLPEFEQVERDLRARAEEMETALQYEHNAELRKQMAKAAQDKKMKQIRRLIQREDKLIQEAKERIEGSVWSSGGKMGKEFSFLHAPALLHIDRSLVRLRAISTTRHCVCVFFLFLVCPSAPVPSPRSIQRGNSATTTHIGRNGASQRKRSQLAHARTHAQAHR
jgi:hypothetical protein